MAASNRQTSSETTTSAPNPKRGTASKVPGTPQEIADATGVTAQRERFDTARQEGSQVRQFTAPNGDRVVEGETVEQMRARVKQEREAEDPTPFMQSITIAANPNAVGGGDAGTPPSGGAGAGTPGGIGTT
jgi:hypothetical protein